MKWNLWKKLCMLIMVFALLLQTNIIPMTVGYAEEGNDLTSAITSLTVSPDTVDHGENVVIHFTWHVSDTTKQYQYQLPENFKIDHETTGNITQGENGDEIGKYNVNTNGLITITYNDDYNQGGNTTNNYMEITGKAVYNPSETDHEIKFEWNGKTSVVTVTNPGEFTITKSSQKTYANNTLSNQSIVQYTVVIESELGTNGPFTIADTLSAENFGENDTFAYVESSFTLKDSSNTSISITPSIDNTNHTFKIENVPKLPAGGKYTLTYDVNVKLDGTIEKPNESITKTLSNTVSATSNEKTHDASDTVIYDQILSKKMYEYNNEEKTMHWISEVKPNGTNIKRFTFSDTIEAAIKYNDEKPRITLSAYDSNNNKITISQPQFTISEDKKTFSFVFPDVADVSKWQIDYYTVVEGASGTQAKVNNTATLTSTASPSETWTAKATGTGNIQGTATRVKTGKGHSGPNEDGTVSFKWTNTIEYENFSKENYEHTDRIEPASVLKSKNDYDSTIYPNDHYAIASEVTQQIKDTLQVTVQNKDNTTSVLNYEEVSKISTISIIFNTNGDSDKGTIVSSDNSTEHIKRWDVKITNGKTLKPLKIEYSYTTYFDLSHYAIGTKWKVGNSLGAEAGWSSPSQEYYVSVKEHGGIDKQIQLSNEPKIWTSADSTFDYYKLKSGETVADGEEPTKDQLEPYKPVFRILASPKENETSLKIVDQLPEGMKLVNDTVKVGNYQDGYNQLSTQWQEGENLTISYDESTNQLTVEANHLGSALQLKDKNTVVIEYQVEVDDENFEDGASITNDDGIYTATRTFNNTATNGDVSDSIGITLVKDEDVVIKEGEQIKEGNALTSRVHYNVQINPKALDLVEGNDEIVLEDTMQSSDLDFKIDITSIKLTLLDGTEVEPIALYVSQPEDDNGICVQTFRITVKDSTAYNLSYDYIADKKEGNNSPTQGDVTNEIKIGGNTNKAASSSLMLAGINVRAASNHAGLEVFKVDSMNNTKFLTATFELAQYVGNEFVKVEEFEVNGSTGKVFDYYEQNCKLQGNTLYRITEVIPPDGYALDDTPTYFIIRGNVEDVRSHTINDTNLTITSENEAKARANAPDNIAIVYYAPNTNSHLELTNEPKSISIQKVWDDEEDVRGERPSTVTVALVKNDVITDETVELNEDNDWHATFENINDFEDGKKIVYSIREVNVPSHYAPVLTGDEDTGFILINTYSLDTTSISGKKVWVDDQDAKGIRPESITVHLLKNGTVIDTLVIGEHDEWQFKFEGLPKHEGGQEIVYTISEETVEGYKSEITGTIETGFMITNTIVKSDPSNPKPDNPNNNTDTKDEKDHKADDKKSSDTDGKTPDTSDFTNTNTQVVFGASLFILLISCIILYKNRRKES